MKSGARSACPATASPSSPAPAPLKAVGVGSHAAVVAALRNAGRFGSSDAWPRNSAYLALSLQAGRSAGLVLEGTREAHVEHVELPLAPLASRVAHDIEPLSYLRFAGAIIDVAPDIERARVAPQYATVARFDPGSDYLFAPGSNRLFELRCAAIRERFPLILATDCAAFFPSVRTEVLRARLIEVTSVEGAARVLEALGALRVHGLPVGAAPQRLLGELMLDPLDRRLLEQGRNFVRQVDDVVVGIDSEKDAEDVMRTIGDALSTAGLTPNKLKTRIVATKACATEEPTVRRLLGGRHAPDRRLLASVLRASALRPPAELLRAAPGETALLFKHVEKCAAVMWAWTGAMAALIPFLGNPDVALRHCRDMLLASNWAVHRVFLIRLLVRMRDAEALPLLEGLASASPSALVRRSAILGLARLRARSALDRTLRHEGTVGDRHARLLAAGAMGMRIDARGPLEEILLEGARTLRQLAL